MVTDMLAMETLAYFAVHSGKLCRGDGLCGAAFSGFVSCAFPTVGYPLGQLSGFRYNAGPSID